MTCSLWQGRGLVGHLGAAGHAEQAVSWGSGKDHACVSAGESRSGSFLRARVCPTRVPWHLHGSGTGGRCGRAGAGSPTPLQAALQQARVWPQQALPTASSELCHGPCQTWPRWRARSGRVCAQPAEDLSSCRILQAASLKAQSQHVSHLEQWHTCPRPPKSLPPLPAFESWFLPPASVTSCSLPAPRRTLILFPSRPLPTLSVKELTASVRGASERSHAVGGACAAGRLCACVCVRERRCCRSVCTASCRSVQPRCVWWVVVGCVLVCVCRAPVCSVLGQVLACQPCAPRLPVCQEAVVRWAARCSGSTCHRGALCLMLQCLGSNPVLACGQRAPREVAADGSGTPMALTHVGDLAVILGCWLSLAQSKLLWPSGE